MMWRNRITETIWIVNLKKETDGRVSLFASGDVHSDVGIVLFFMHLVRIRAGPLIPIELIDLSHVIR